MKQFVFQVIGLLILIFGGIYYAYSGGLAPRISGPNDPQAGTYQLRILDSSSSDPNSFKAQISAELAQTAETRQLGLGGRTFLDPNSGMLFIFEKPERLRFWMKGLSFPLDFIWINGYEVVDLTKNVPAPDPGTPDQALPIYSPSREADKVLEVNAGFIDAHQIKLGDKIQLLQSDAPLIQTPDPYYDAVPSPVQEPTLDPYLSPSPYLQY